MAGGVRGVALDVAIWCGAAVMWTSVAVHCTKAPPVSPDQRVYGALVEAGCLAPDNDAGVSAIIAEHAMGTDAWLQCLYTDGGTVASCGVPCSSLSKRSPK